VTFMGAVVSVCVLCAFSFSYLLSSVFVSVSLCWFADLSVCVL
jgi:hypothetical protein